MLKVKIFVGVLDRYKLYDELEDEINEFLGEIGDAEIVSATQTELWLDADNPNMTSVTYIVIYREPIYKMVLKP
jgi:hypothetical protein